MSQKKVDLYKEQKRNRKKIMKKEKRMRILGYTVAGLVSFALVGWAGFSAYNYYETNKPVSYTDVNTDAISDYYTNLDVN